MCVGCKITVGLLGVSTLLVRRDSIRGFGPQIRDCLRDGIAELRQQVGDLSGYNISVLNGWDHPQVGSSEDEIIVDGFVARHSRTHHQIRGYQYPRFVANRYDKLVGFVRFRCEVDHALVYS